LQDANSWIFFPPYVEFSFSDDGKTFNQSVRILNDKSQHDEHAQVFRFTQPVKGLHTRYIKVFAKNVGICPSWHRGAGGKAWLFVDELTVGTL
jgi:hypothetical protein